MEEIARIAKTSASAKKVETTQREFSAFLKSIPSTPNLQNCADVHVVMFLVYKEKSGRTKVHNVNCPLLGSESRKPPCPCPLRLAAATTEGISGRLREILSRVGRGAAWNEKTLSGNPAASLRVKEYLKVIREEQAASHTQPRQAKPIFAGKVKALIQHLESAIAACDPDSTNRFLLMRDRAFFSVMFFGGDRAADLGRLKCQEIRRLEDNSGLVISRSFGKTLRGKGCNIFVLPRCPPEEALCPVRSLEALGHELRRRGIDPTVGFVFRPLDNRGQIANRELSYSVTHARLGKHLAEAGLLDGETPHSFRAGCAVAMMLGGEKGAAVMSHIGWSSAASLERYSKTNVLYRDEKLATGFASSLGESEHIENTFRRLGNPANLSCAFDY